MEKAEIDNANRLKMKVINDEMRDILMMAKDTKSAIQEMNDAFKGEQEVDYVPVVKGNKVRVKKVARRKTVERQASTAHNRELEPVYEVQDQDDSRALIAFDNPKQKKRERLLLKERAKQVTGELGKNPYLFGKESTFVTGGGLPGRQKAEGDSQADEESEENMDEDLEDQLLREVDQHEKDFKDMFEYLNDIEDLLHGNEIK